MISPEVLRRFPCFAPVSEESLKAVAMMARAECLRAGSRLFGEGDPADRMSLIVDGAIDIQYQLADGELRTLDTLIAGDIVGWSAMVEPYKMTGTATAGKDTNLIMVDAKPLRALCERDPLLGYRLLKQVARLLADRLDAARVQLATAE
jgi:CRP-like cAMP-binding protein